MSGQVVLITGCSTGIGRHLAQYLNGVGYRVVATARRRETLTEISAALKLPLDVTDSDSVAAAVAETVRHFGRIDVLVNNAGYGQLGPVEELSDAVMHQVFEVNVHGVARMVRAVLPHMRSQGSGRIINLSSIAGLVSFPMWGAYSGTKYAVEAISDALRMEVAPFGVKVVVIEPPAINTQFEQTARAAGSSVLSPSSPYHAMYERFDRFFAAMNAGAPGPEAVSRVVRRAIEVPRPKARYQVTIQAVLMSKLLPLLKGALFDRVVRRVVRQ